MMEKRKGSTGRSGPASDVAKPGRRLPGTRLPLLGPAAIAQALLHPVPTEERPWRLLPRILLLAFAARAAVALSGDFVLHPDEIMQYLEPAHWLAFGSGIPALGVLLRRARLAGPRLRRRSAARIRCRGARGPVVVRGRRQTCVLCRLAGHPGRHVLLRTRPLRRVGGTHRAGNRRVLVRARGVRTQAHDRNGRDGAADGPARALRRGSTRWRRQGMGRGPRRRARGGDPSPVRAARAAVAGGRVRTRWSPPAHGAGGGGRRAPRRACSTRSPGMPTCSTPMSSTCASTSSQGSCGPARVRRGNTCRGCSWRVAASAPCASQARCGGPGGTPCCSRWSRSAWRCTRCRRTRSIASSLP